MPNATVQTKTRSPVRCIPKPLTDNEREMSNERESRVPTCGLRAQVWAPSNPHQLYVLILTRSPQYKRRRMFSQDSQKQVHLPQQLRITRVRPQRVEHRPTFDAKH